MSSGHRESLPLPASGRAGQVFPAATPAVPRHLGVVSFLDQQ
jgi:hypothetical protein